MRRLGRKGRVLKWAGLISSLLIFLACVGTLWGWLSYDWTAGPTIAVTGSSSRRYVVHSVALGRGLLVYSQLLYQQPEPGWHYQRTGLSGTSGSIQRITLTGPDGGEMVMLPLWLPFSIVVIATASLSWADRRRFRPGRCQACAYDLTGNTSGVCPECGAAVPGRGSSDPDNGVH